MKKNLKTNFNICLLVSFVIAAISTLASAQENQHLLIVPFEIHAADDHDFLKPAVTDMLYSRLVQKDRHASVAKIASPDTVVSLEDAIELGRQQNAHYLIRGSITILDTLISTDARLIDIQTQSVLMSFNQVGQNQGDIITHMEQLAARINEVLSEKNNRPGSTPNPGDTFARAHGPKTDN